MQVKFVHQVLIGTRVFGADEVADLGDAREREDLIRRGIAIEHVEAASVPSPAPIIREAVSTTQSQSRKAVSRS